MRWKTYFFFTHQERRGIGGMSVVIALLVVLRLVVSHTLAAQTDLAPLQNTLAYGDSLFQQSPDYHSPSTQKRRQYPSRTQKTSEMVELNSADTTRLKQLRGIGSGYARMIVRYRKKLGGFYHKEQLLEVYHFSRETFERIEGQLVVDTALIQPLYINELGLEELKRHPYIRYFQAKSLVENRKKRPDGRYHSIHDIPRDQDVTEEFLERIQPYVSFR